MLAGNCMSFRQNDDQVDLSILHLASVVLKRAESSPHRASWLWDQVQRFPKILFLLASQLQER